MDIQQAIQLEQEYLSLPPKEADEFNLKGKLEGLGYTFETFSKAKENFNFENLNVSIRESSPDTIFADLQTSFGLDEEVFFFVSPVKNWVYVGQEEYDKDYCEQNNISVLPLSYNGGTIVTTDKDFNLVIALKSPNLMYLILKKISDILSDLGLENEVVGNDMYVNGNKIVGCAENRIGDYFMSYFQISFAVDIDLIRAISKKEMIKIPKGISEFSTITREDLIKELTLWLQ